MVHMIQINFTANLYLYALHFSHLYVICMYMMYIYIAVSPYRILLYDLFEFFLINKNYRMFKIFLFIFLLIYYYFIPFISYKMGQLCSFIR